MCALSGDKKAHKVKETAVAHYLCVVILFPLRACFCFLYLLPLSEASKVSKHQAISPWKPAKMMSASSWSQPGPPEAPKRSQNDGFQARWGADKIGKMQKFLCVAVLFALLSKVSFLLRECSEIGAGPTPTSRKISASSAQERVYVDVKGSKQAGEGHRPLMRAQKGM